MNAKAGRFIAGFTLCFLVCFGVPCSGSCFSINPTSAISCYHPVHEADESTDTNADADLYDEDFLALVVLSVPVQNDWVMNSTFFSPQPVVGCPDACWQPPENR
jgi:hypothetical protein